MSLRFAEFQEWMPNYNDFERMKHHNDMYVDMQYDEFVEWNEKCFNEVSDDDRPFLENTIKYIASAAISLVDMESCVEFEAAGVYFNTKKSICIFNPR